MCLSKPRERSVISLSPGQLLTRAAFIHHDDQRHDALMHYSVLKGLKAKRYLPGSWVGRPAPGPWPRHKSENTRLRYLVNLSE